jgi:hypothetical protein
MCQRRVPHRCHCCLQRQTLLVEMPCVSLLFVCQLFTQGGDTWPLSGPKETAATGRRVRPQRPQRAQTRTDGTEARSDQAPWLTSRTETARTATKGHSNQTNPDNCRQEPRNIDLGERKAEKSKNKQVR